MAVVGIGVDRVEIARIADSYAQFGQRFVRRIYSADEFAQAQAKQNIARRLAMLFAGKEAVSKALGTGFHQGVSAGMIEIIHLPSGQPTVRLSRGALAAAERLSVGKVHISLSDDGGVAVAFAIAEQ